MRNLKLVSPGTKPQLKSGAGYDEIDRIIVALESKESLNVNDVAAAMMAAILGVVGHPGEASFDRGIHTYLFDRLESLNPSSEMFLRIAYANSLSDVSELEPAN